MKIAAMTFSETPTLAIPVLPNMSVSFRTFFILAMTSLHVSFAVVHRVIKQTIKANLTKSSVEEFAFEVASFFSWDVFQHFLVPHDVKELFALPLFNLSFTIVHKINHGS